MVERRGGKGQGPGRVKLVLASSSPRRQAILRMLCQPYETRVVQIDESPLADELPLAAARRVAWSKASAALSATNEIVVGADTVVVVDGQILGKPRDAAEAQDMLETLRGRRHEVITGLAIANSEAGLAYIGSTTTAVWMRDYSDQEIARYIARGEPFDKAGGYAIQSKSFRPVERIEGCYLNVVGLPMCQLVEGLLLVAPSVNWEWKRELSQACTVCGAKSCG